MLGTESSSAHPAHGHLNPDLIGDDPVVGSTPHNLGVGQHQNAECIELLEPYNFH